MSKYDASKFLMQASIGANKKDIEELSNVGKKRWILNQFSKPMNDSCEKKVDNIWNHFVKELSSLWGEDKIEGNELVLPYWFYFRMSWWDTILKTDEVLRHRIALALSEILVISDKSVLELNSYGLANYYDMLYKHAFGNYEELLYDVTMHPCMGVYLTHLNNPKEDKDQNIHPDENFAREIMQLFTIGLYELNLDGTKKLDRKGNPIPTYDNEDIKELAKVFTGFAPGKYWWPWEDYSEYEVYWGVKENKIPNIDLTVPMQIFEEHHETSEKILLKKKKIKPNQYGESDIKETVKFLVKEQNTAVFISKKLIQSLTTSNPSKKYIKDVAKTFIDNGKGVTGDLKAVVLKILLHSEASSGVKLKEPMLRTTQILRGFGAHNDSGKLWGTGFNIEENLKQHPLSAPSVFNFFQSDYSPYGKIKEKGLVAPEFKLMDAATSIAYVNLMYEWFFGESYLLVSTLPSSTRFDAPELDWDRLKKEDLVKLDLSYEENLAKENPSKLIDHLDLVLCAGKLSKETKKDILESIIPYKDRADWIVQTALFMITISPDFTIEA
jgi:uncharacterized protein (DUF1800 family)